jgi:urease accessory protein UreH
MPTKTAITLSVAAILLLVAALLHGQTTPTGAARYQLVSSPYAIWMKNGPTLTETTIFKIDTTTGKTWKYVTGQDKDGKPMDGWNPMQ